MATSLTVRSDKMEERSRVATLIARTYMQEGAETIELTAKLREWPSHRPDLSLVGVESKEIILYTMFTPLDVDDHKNAVVFMAPVALDTYRESIDFAAFLEQAFKRVLEAGYRYIIVHGEAEIYQEAGFVQGKELGLKSSLDMPESEFLVNDLGEEVGDTVTGTVKYPGFLG